MLSYESPGVYRAELEAPPVAELRTGVPMFLGYSERGPVGVPTRISGAPEFEAGFGQPHRMAYLAHAVHGFFRNGGSLCYVLRLDDAADPATALRAGLVEIEAMDQIDIVCVPDIVRPRGDQLLADPDEVAEMQVGVLDHCAGTGDRFALLEPLPGAGVEEVLRQRLRLGGRPDGALYYPWIRVLDGPERSGGFVPPCGHVAGVYARTDARVGVHKAPANEVLEGVLDLEADLSSQEQAELNPTGVNCLRAFPGRGIRVWGARTLGDEPWRYVSVRRLFLTAGRRLRRVMVWAVFEPNGPAIWASLTRDLSAYLDSLFRDGALLGRTPEEAFYVKCDAETNPEERREAGEVVAEIGLAPVRPNEFVVVQIVAGAAGIKISGPARPE